MKGYLAVATLTITWLLLPPEAQAQDPNHHSRLSVAGHVGRLVRFGAHAGSGVMDKRLEIVDQRTAPSRIDNSLVFGPSEFSYRVPFVEGGAVIGWHRLFGGIDILKARSGSDAARQILENRVSDDFGSLTSTLDLGTDFSFNEGYFDVYGGGAFGFVDVSAGYRIGQLEVEYQMAGDFVERAEFTVTGQIFDITNAAAYSGRGNLEIDFSGPWGHISLNRPVGEGDYKGNLRAGFTVAQRKARIRYDSVGFLSDGVSMNNLTGETRPVPTTPLEVTLPDLEGTSTVLTYAIGWTGELPVDGLIYGLDFAYSPAGYADDQDPLLTFVDRTSIFRFFLGFRR